MGTERKINRDDMLELTRRMTLKRNCFGRIAGGYYDENGFLEGSFNTHFGKLSAAEQNRLLAIAKAIPFAETNVKLKEHGFTQDERKSSAWRTLTELNRCQLKNDELLENLYEALGHRLAIDHACGLYFFQGVYDIPLKGSDKIEQWESEEVYQFIICALCPIDKDYVPSQPEEGFLFPAFVDRSSDADYIDLFQSNGDEVGLLYLFWD